MKKKSVLFFLIALVFLVGIAQATLLNTTTIESRNLVASPAAVGTFNAPFTYTFPNGQALMFAKVTPNTEGQTINFRFSRPSATDITGSITTVSTGLLSGNLVVSIDGGTTSTESFHKFLVSPFSIIQSTAFYYVSDGVNWYIIESDNDIAQMDITYQTVLHVDTTSGMFAVLQVSSPSQDPITGITLTPLATGSYGLETYYEDYSTVAQDVTKANQTLTEKQSADRPWDQAILDLINTITSGIEAIKSFLLTITSLSTWLFAIAAFIFAVKSFLAINVLITLINIMWCIRPGRDIFQAPLEFQRNEMKLIEFYMQLVLYGKRLIKWW
jgi:hypothetical protein